MQSGTTILADRPLQGEIAALREAVEARLDGLFPAGSSLVEDAMREALRGPAKRLRPLIAILGARDLGWDGSAVDVGCALELVHTASLILDDLPCMDDATLRRGKPAIHVTFGEDVAGLAAIALLARAYALLAGATGLSSGQRVELVAILSEAVGPLGLVGGQLEDLRGGPDCAERARAVNGRKTGALFVASARMACVMAQSPARCRTLLEAFGSELGFAFQILDDLLDLGGNPAQMGKPNGQDAGKPTIVRLLGAAGGQAHMERHIAAAAAALGDLPSGGERIACLLETLFAVQGWQPPASARVAGQGPC